MEKELQKKFVVNNSLLMSEWDKEKNEKEGCFPEKLTESSYKKVWWKCSNGHEWREEICKRAQGKRCPFCANKRVLIGFNDLATLYPHLAKEWDYEKNTIAITSVVRGSAKIVWWKCSKCGYKWQASIRARTQRKTGCPKCAREIVQKSRMKTFLEKKGGLHSSVYLADWDYENNGDLQPKDITEGSNKLINWVCPKCGYKWKTRVLNKRGCPCCSNRVVVAGINDLATTHPKLAAEWDYEKNGDLTPQKVTHGSGKKVFWKCPIGNSYRASILHRSSGTNCPICNSGRQTSFAEQALFFYIKKIHPDAINRYNEIFENRRMEVDIYIPSMKTAIEYDGAFWHKNKRKLEQEKYKICRQKGIKLIRLREGEDYNSRGIADSCYHTDHMDNIQNLENIITFFLRSLEKFNAKYISHPLKIDLKRDNFEIRKYMVERNNSLEDERPDLAGEWYYEKNGSLTPRMFLANSSQKIWWKCKNCGHIWKTSINARTAGAGCEVCFRINNRGANHSEAKKIFQYSKDGVFIKEWECISDACRELKINSSNVSMCAKHQRRVAGGYRWEYFYVEKLETIVPVKKRKAGTGGKPVLQLDEGNNVLKEYSSLTEAEKKTGINATCISKVLHGQQKKAGGFIWRTK